MGSSFVSERTLNPIQQLLEMKPKRLRDSTENDGYLLVQEVIRAGLRNGGL
jgi:hypothetical protein